MIACAHCGTGYDPQDTSPVQMMSASSAGLTGPRYRGPHCPACTDDLQHLYQLLYRDLHFCGCGNPEDSYDLVGTILGLLAERKEQDDQDPELHSGLNSPRMIRWEAFREAVRGYIGGNDGTFYLVMYLLDHAGLTEHGGSVSRCWIDRKGEHYLTLMNQYEYGEAAEAGYPHDGEECGPGCRHWEASTWDWQKKETRRQLTKGLPG